MPQLAIDSVDDLLLFERIESFGGGMDAFTRSTLLPPDTNQRLENCIVLENLEARTRPGADALGNATVDGGGAGALQGLAYYDSPTAQRLLTAKGNSFWKWDGAAWAAQAGFNVTNGGQFIAAQGVDKLLISDAVQALQLWDGTTFTSLGNVGPITATALWFGVGRMFATGFSGAGATARDAVWPSMLLDMSATGWRPTDSIRIGAGDGDPVIAGAVLPSTSNNSYVQAVFKRNSVWMFNADPTQPPANWQVLQLAPGTGIVGRRAFAQIGNDLLFFSQDGVRSVRRMQSAAGQVEVAPPISLPMQPWIDRINWAYASGICATRYRELVLFAVPLDAATTNNTLLVFNGRLQKWTGIWTGWSPVAFSVSQFGGVSALNIADTTGRVNQYKDSASKTLGTTYLENGAAIPTRVWTRAATFGDLVNPKQAYHAETRFTDGSAVVNISAVCDNVAQRTWQANLQPNGPVLPVKLNFVLGVGAPTRTQRGLRGLPQFSEIYLKIESNEGWFSCRNVTLGAFLNMLKTT